MFWLGWSTIFLFTLEEDSTMNSDMMVRQVNTKDIFVKNQCFKAWMTSVSLQRWVPENSFWSHIPWRTQDSELRLCSPTKTSQVQCYMSCIDLFSLLNIFVETHGLRPKQFPMSWRKQVLTLSQENTFLRNNEEDEVKLLDFGATQSRDAALDSQTF